MSEDTPETMASAVQEILKQSATQYVTANAAKFMTLLRIAQRAGPDAEVKLFATILLQTYVAGAGEGIMAFGMKLDEHVKSKAAKPPAPPTEPAKAPGAPFTFRPPVFADAVDPKKDD